jgi:hypothetical protein
MQLRVYRGGNVCFRASNLYCISVTAGYKLVSQEVNVRYPRKYSSTCRLPTESLIGCCGTLAVTSNQSTCLLVTANVVSSLLILVTVMMEAPRSSETT